MHATHKYTNSLNEFMNAKLSIDALRRWSERLIEGGVEREECRKAHCKEEI